MPTSRQRDLSYGLIATFFITAIVWACGQAASEPASDPMDAGGGGNNPLDGSTASTPDSSASDSGHAARDASVGTGDDIATTPNLKVAFVGDTGTGDDFKSVLQLVKKEGAKLLVVQGDLNYTFLGSASSWFKVIDGEINSTLPGSSATATIPYFIAKGNHDVDWNAYGSGMTTRMGQWGITPEDGDPAARNYSVVYNGLKLVMVDDSETTPSRADYIDQQLVNDTHLWKICSWHKNQRNSNVGPKSDEMGWAVYEKCREHGAIVAQGHSHTYSRSKTLTNDANQTVDSTCSDPFGLCVGTGKHFFFDSSLGGQDIRPLDTKIAGMPHWASTYSGAFGALFIEFNVDGDSKKAQAYFKTTGDTIVDPPASSGKTRFTITRDP